VTSNCSKSKDSLGASAWRDLDPGSFVRAADSATRGVPLDAKKRIGAIAAGLLHPDETVILDVGTTTLEMAKAISPDLSLSVITSSLLIASELDRKPKVRTIVTGGVLRSGEMSLVGSRAEASYRDLNCDTLFLGVAGVDIDKGLSEYNMDDAHGQAVRSLGRATRPWCWPTLPRLATWLSSAWRRSML